MLKKILSASESYVGLAGVLLQALPVSQDLKDHLIYPIWTYVAARLVSKGAKAVVGAQASN